MIKGFKEFILRGNVIDLAVAVVVGTAFTAVVNAIVSSIINPLIALVWKPNDDGQIVWTVNGLWGPVEFPIGALINAIIAFLAVAIVVYFVFVHPMNLLKERQARTAGAASDEEEPLPTEQELLAQIRDLLATQGQTANQPPTTRP